MKLKLTIVIALLFVQLTFAQDLTALKNGAQKIYIATTTLDYDAILDSTYPKLFDIVSREQMSEMLAQTFSGNEQMKIKLLNLEPDFKFGEIKKIDGQTFCLIDHNLGMELTLTEKVEGEEIQMMIDLMKEAMESDNVTFKPETNTFTISKKATMIGISDALTKNEWKFINRDKKNVLVTKLFSEKVIKELGM
ncbi:hypothetical protein [Flavobacterium terrisoli]|uniref:hypothetical protein n=1 Tax=Flavobacterium terrisoli TaxID=3242195 RepID=UPI002542EF2B|nr:hypothetical protein [Flavobacterium buctense]